jgi:hypothetical protein
VPTARLNIHTDFSGAHPIIIAHPAAVRRTRTPGGQPIVISSRILRPDRVAAHQMVSGTHQRRALGGIERRREA